ncbi:MAG: hypothetical protein OEM97_04900 [Acidimicrobiia bacterium]|nr:hypothetical protein [Acidimicrobiia bacterium]
MSDRRDEQPTDLRHLVLRADFSPLVDQPGKAWKILRAVLVTGVRSEVDAGLTAERRTHP